jgi:succinate dehydrogenase / fumarate reductase cytochrome b subunit
MTTTAPSRSSAAAAPLPLSRLQAGHTPFILRRLHSLTGILFGLYVMIHLLVNATLVEGFREGAPITVYQKQVNSIHAIPFLTATEWLLIYLPILYHTFYGLWLTYTAQPNINQYPYGKNIFYLFQRLTALVLVAFIFFHVTAMKGWWATSLKFDPWRATETAVGHLTASWFIGWFVYPVGILAACYHLANGFWTAAISWGVTISRGAQRRWGWACVGIFILTYLLGMTALVAALTSAALAHHG